MFKRISVGGKMAVGFGVQIALILLSALIAVVSARSRITALNHIDAVATLQGSINAELKVYNEARLLADEVIEVIDHDVYEAFESKARQAAYILAQITAVADEMDSPLLAPAQRMADDLEAWSEAVATVEQYNEKLERMGTDMEQLAGRMSQAGRDLFEDTLGSNAGHIAEAANIMEAVGRVRVGSAPVLLLFDTEDTSALAERIDDALSALDLLEKEAGADVSYPRGLVEEYRGGILEFARVSEESGTEHELRAEKLAASIAAQAVALSDAAEAELDTLFAASRESSARLLLYTAVLTTLAVAVGLFVAIRLTNVLTGPLGRMERYLVRAAQTGNLDPLEKDAAGCERDAALNDEVGRSVQALYALVARLRAVGDSLEQVADCDLTGDLEPLSDQDTMGRSLQRMRDNLNELFGQINESANEMAGGAAQLAASAENLAQNNSEQAAAVEELNASIAEIAAQSHASGERTGTAVQHSSRVGEIAQAGTESMEEMLQAMQDISKHGYSIQKVTKTIDDLSFQTKILALNAAVEAARASTGGKGFAVVAGEVRNLASRSAQAAGDTAKMIDATIPEIERGIRISQETADAFADIIGGVRRSGQDVEEIARILDEQTKAFEQIRDGIEQIAGSVQQNSSTSEQTAAASEVMNSQAQQLHELIDRFALREEEQEEEQEKPAKKRKSKRKTAVRGKQDKY